MTNDIEDPSVIVNDRTTANEATGVGTHTWHSLSLSRAIKLGFVLVAVAIAVILGVTQGGPSRDKVNSSAPQVQGLQNGALRIIDGSEVSESCTSSNF